MTGPWPFPDLGWVHRSLIVHGTLITGRLTRAILGGVSVRKSVGLTREALCFLRLAAESYVISVL